MKKILIITALALLTSSCGIYRKYSRPVEIEPSTATLYRGTAAEATDSLRSLGKLGWREMFTDKCLQRLIDTALVRNTNLRTAHLRVEEAEAALKAAKLAYVPSFGFAPNGAVNSFDYAKATWLYSVPVTASWQVDVFGNITTAKRRAKAAAECSRDYRDAVQTQIVAAVANNYYTLLTLDAQLAIARKTANSWGEIVSTMRLLKDAGMGNEASVRQMEASYYAVSTMVQDLEHQVFELENALCMILAQSPQYIERTTLAEQVMPEQLYTGVPVALLAARPDVRAAEKGLEQAFYGVASARAALYPSLNLSGVLGWTNNVGSVVVNPGSLLWNAALSLFQPIFQNGQLRARLKISKLQAEESLLAFQQTLLEAGNQVNSALEHTTTARNKAALIAKQVEALAAAAESTELMMEHGSATYLEVLVARQSLLDAELSQCSNTLAQIQGVVNLYTALGGGVTE
ncbi:MAG: efflux transporter outer membrane subunit [Alistipes sp.]|nr:efflux transporter outer membrane subunit [Alistipes sp.]